MRSPSAAKHDQYFRKISFQFQACLPALIYIKDLRQAARDIPIYKSACVHARQHRCGYSGDICYAEQASSLTNTAGSTNCSLQTLQITHLPGLSAPPGCAHSHVHKFRLSICAFVLLMTSQQRSGLSDGLVLPQSMPPATLTRPDQSPANNRVQSAACRRSLSLSRK